MGFLAELDEQNHVISHGAGGDMCEGTAAIARPWLARGRMFAWQQRSKKSRIENKIKIRTEKHFTKTRAKKHFYERIEVFLRRNRE